MIKLKINEGIYSKYQPKQIIFSRADQINQLKFVINVKAMTVYTGGGYLKKGRKKEYLAAQKGQ